MLPELPFSVLQFTYQAVEPIIFPKQSGVLWHKVFGRGLVRTSCVIPAQKCIGCMLLHQCDYPYVFSRIAPPDSEMMRGKPIPVPHVFRSDYINKQHIDSGETFSVELIIVGQAIEKTPSIARAMLVAGMDGFGKQRGRARLLSVRQTGPIGSVLNIFKDGRLIADPLPQQIELPTAPTTVRLVFITPYKPTGKNTSGRMLMAIIRRISLLQYFYTGKRLETDFKKLKIQTNQVKVLSNSLQWQKGERYSSSHGGHTDTGGWTGDLKLQINANPEIWAYLWIGQWIGMGKNASMGFGRYAIS